MRCVLVHMKCLDSVIRPNSYHKFNCISHGFTVLKTSINIYIRNTPQKIKSKSPHCRRSNLEQSSWGLSATPLFPSDCSSSARAVCDIRRTRQRIFWHHGGAATVAATGTGCTRKYPPIQALFGRVSRKRVQKIYSWYSEPISGRIFLKYDKQSVQTIAPPSNLGVCSWADRKHSCIPLFPGN